MRHRLPLATLLVLLSTISGSLQAQVTGGRQAFAFLDLPASARLTSLGGYLISARDQDISLGAVNPALLNAAMHQQLSFNHNFHIGGTGQDYLAYGYHIQPLNLTLQAGFRRMDYGDIDWRDEFNQDLGTFSPREVAAHIGAGWQWQDHHDQPDRIKLARLPA